jgi:DNA-binding transcriptional regulator YhcF (GntR family)
MDSVVTFGPAACIVVRTECASVLARRGKDGMIYQLGPRALRVYTALHNRIMQGDWAPGTKLPSHRELAVEFGVAPLTVRQVLAQLEGQGLVSRRSGSGTFVREAAGLAVLIIENGSTMGAFLADYVTRAGFRPLVVNHPSDALTILAADENVALILCDVDTPDAAQGTASIRIIRARHPQFPLAAVATDMRDLAELFGTADWPLLVLPKPINLGQLDELLRLSTPQRGLGS